MLNKEVSALIVIEQEADRQGSLKEKSGNVQNRLQRMKKRKSSGYRIQVDDRISTSGEMREDEAKLNKELSEK